MKKLLLLLTVMMGALTAHADDYSYLTFETTDGSLTSVSVTSLTITISGTTLTAGDKTFNLSDLTKMYFSTSDVTAIDQVNADNGDHEVEVFTINGTSMGKYTSMRDAASSLKSGVYVMKSKSKTVKVAVK